MKILHSRTDVGATGRSPAPVTPCGRPAGRPYENYHSRWRAAGSWKLGGKNRIVDLTTRTPRHQEPSTGAGISSIRGCRKRSNMVYEAVNRIHDPGIPT